VRWITVLSSVVLMMGAAPPSAKAVDLVAVRAPLGTADEVFAGCELVRIDADGKTTVLTPEFAAAKDPSVAFDGHTILFAGRRASSDPWQIWRIGSDGSNPTRIIADGGNATAPLHVGSLFHLDDERPTERFVYLSDTHGWVDPFTGKKAIALYAADLDGGNPWRISFNLGSDMAPDVLANGRLVFPSRRADGRVALMAVNNDGTDLMAYADAHTGPAHQNTVAVGPNHIYLVATDSPGPLGGGALVQVSQRRPLRSRSVLAPESDGWYHSPRPLVGGGLVVSFLPRDGSGGYRLVRVDPETGKRIGREIVADGLHLIDAQELTSRPRVRGRSSVVKMAADTGVFFCISSHLSDRPGVGEAARAATRLRVIEGVPPAPGSTPSSPPQQRVLGELPIEGDGSFHIEVPASTPIAFALLDAEGRVVARQEDWVWVMPREWRGCIGCHEDREMVPPNVLAEAVVQPAVRLPMPAAEAQGDAGGLP
jgi:hypothetical protein